MNRLSSAFLAAVLTAALSFPAAAETFRVGPKEKYQSVSDVAESFSPGDVVEVTGDISGTFTLTRHGTSDRPITIRGVTRVDKGRIVRPKAVIERDAPSGIVCKGDWNVIEGLDISGAVGTSLERGTAINCASDNLTVRNCYIHHNKQGVFGDFKNSGSIRIEFSEFDSNGGRTPSGDNMHTIFVNSTKAGATAVLENCYLHDGVMNCFFKSRCSRNVVRYNWFENEYYACLYIVDANMERAKGTLGLYPMHSDIVGNVFFAGWSPSDRWKLLHLGSEGEDAPGTEGTFDIAHNLFVVTNGGSDPSAPVLVNGNVDRVRIFNNVFLPYGVARFKLYERGGVWDSPQTEAFVARRGNAEPVIEGSNNWVSERAIGIPDALTNTLRGLNPKFVDLVNFDFRPAANSPLVRAGGADLPMGATVLLVPEFEPQRGIPLDLKPRPRRKATPPSIGPFEAEK